MTTISAKCVLASLSETGIPIHTLKLRYPKVIHGEFMTHRVFSRNASSSRAIPVARLIQDVIDDPFVPLSWGKNQRGMQAGEECDEPVGDWREPEGAWFSSREFAWIAARDQMIEIARAYAKAGYHKQIVNRLLEPFCHIEVVVTATDWSNFFALRCHLDAEPHMRMLAEAMRTAIAEAPMQKLKPGEWHLPFVTEEEYEALSNTTPSDPTFDDYLPLIQCSVARCARVSYLNHDGTEPNIVADLKLYDLLVGSTPLHASPAEHQATPDIAHDMIGLPAGKPSQWAQAHLHGNFRGWVQYRKTLPGESQQ